MAPRSLHSWAPTLRARSLSPCTPARSPFTRRTAQSFTSLGRGALDDRRSRPAALQLRTRTAAHHRPQRRRQPHQAPPASPTTRFPQNLVQAVLAIEDRRFFEHSGVNYCQHDQVGMTTHRRSKASRRRLHADHATGAKLLHRRRDETIQYKLIRSSSPYNLSTASPRSRSSRCTPIRSPRPARQLLHRRLRRSIPGLLR